MLSRLADINPSNLLISDDAIYQIVDGKKKKLYVSTPVLACSKGIDDSGFIELELNISSLTVLSAIDKWLEDRLENYRPIVKSDMIKVKVDTETKIYDRDNGLVDNRDCLSCKFKARLVLGLNEVFRVAESVLVSIKVLQLKVYTFSLLPEGCSIHHSVDEFNASRSEVGGGVEVGYDEPVTDFDPEINELLDS